MQLDGRLELAGMVSSIGHNSISDLKHGTIRFTTHLIREQIQECLGLFFPDRSLVVIFQEELCHCAGNRGVLEDTGVHRILSARHNGGPGIHGATSTAGTRTPSRSKKKGVFRSGILCRRDEAIVRAQGGGTT